MGNKTNPISNRLGIITGWKSSWFGLYPERIQEDYKIRKHIEASLLKVIVSLIYIERRPKFLTVTIFTSRPSLVIGKGGEEVDKLRRELKVITKKKYIQVNIHEVKRPELDARLIAKNVASQIEKRVSFKKVIKQAVYAAMRMNEENNVYGIKIQVSGRLNGAEIARTEYCKEGKISLSTFRMDIDYATAEAHTTYGRIGIKVWINKGEVYGKRELSTII
ncbi:MAG TPA: 30S ribosomal protein S3 [Candidatus Angelobacter sp.]|jgi:small subunit ribosomal protein S3|nr:30S ribosomal protein S3 [Candidatus Angelobacter sp.]